MTMLLAPIVSEKATYIADKHNQVIFRVRPDATKGEVKAAVELDVEGQEGRSRERPDRQRARQGQALRRVQGPSPPLEEGVRQPEAGPGTQLRHGGLDMALVKVKPTSPGRRGAGQGRQRRPAQGPAGRIAHRSEEARLGPQQQRPHHHAAQGWRPQAALSHRRFPSQQGRHPGEGRAAGVRPEPQRASGAAALHRRRAPLHRRRREALPRARN